MFELPRSRTTHVRVTRNPDGGLLVYDVRSDAGHVLNQAVGLVYELADGQRSVQEIAALLPEMVGLPADDEIVILSLQQLDEACLLESEAAAAQEPEGRISRRGLMSRLSLAAGAMALLPALDSIGGLSRAAAQDSVGSSSSTVAADGAYTMTG